MLDWSTPGPKYYEMVMDHMHLAGMKLLPIINRKDHPQQYREWYAYYGFRKMLAALEAGNWHVASAELIDSEYTQLVGKRAYRLAAMLKLGVDV